MSATRTANGKYRGPVPEAYIEVTSVDGTAVRTAMLTQREKERRHQAGRCDALCSYCITEAEEYLAARGGKP
jgi:predicted nucleotidyltransferase